MATRDESTTGSFLLVTCCIEKGVNRMKNFIARNIFTALWFVVALVGLYGSWVTDDLAWGAITVGAIIGIRVERLFGRAALAADKFLRETASEVQVGQ